MTNPVIIGKGTPILAGLGQKLNLELIKTNQLKSGNVLLYYEPVQMSLRKQAKEMLVAPRNKSLLQSFGFAPGSDGPQGKTPMQR